MKKITAILSLFLIVGFGTASHAQEIHINPFSVQSNQLTVSIWGVTSVPNAQYEIALRYKHQQWMTVQSTTAPLAGTGFIGMHIVGPTSSLHAGDYFRSFGTLVDASIMRTCTVVYVVRRHCMNSVILSETNASQRALDLLKGKRIDKRATGGEASDVSDQTSIENLYIGTGDESIDLGNGLELVKMTEEELLSEQIVTPFDAVSITTSGRRLNFSIPENVDFRFDLIDMNGKKCDHGHQSSNYRVDWVEYPALAPGMYIVQCTETSTGMIRSFKLMISE